MSPTVTKFHIQLTIFFLPKKRLRTELVPQHLNLNTSICMIAQKMDHSSHSTTHKDLR